MEVYYCKKCRARVSSFDVNENRGMMTDDGEVFCRKCIKQLGLEDVLQAEASKPRKKKVTTLTKIRTAEISRAVRQSTRLRGPVSGTLPPSQAELTAQKRNQFVIAVSIIAAIVIAAALIIFINRKSDNTHTVASSTAPIHVHTEQSTISPQTTGPDPVKLFPEADGWKTLISPDFKSTFNIKNGSLSFSEDSLVFELPPQTAITIEDKNQYSNHEIGLIFSVSGTCSKKLFFRKTDKSSGFAYIENVTPGKQHIFRLKIEDKSCISAEYDGGEYAGRDLRTVRVTQSELKKIGKTGMLFQNRGTGTVTVSISALSYRGQRFTEKKVIKISRDWLLHQGDDQAWKEPDIDESDWTQAEIGKKWEEDPGWDVDGFVWYRKKVDTPEVPEGSIITYKVKKVDNEDWTYINGEQVGHTDNRNATRYYKILRYSTNTVPFRSQYALKTTKVMVESEAKTRHSPFTYLSSKQRNRESNVISLSQASCKTVGKRVRRGKLIS